MVPFITDKIFNMYEEHHYHYFWGGLVQYCVQCSVLWRIFSTEGGIPLMLLWGYNMNCGGIPGKPPQCYWNPSSGLTPSTVMRVSPNCWWDLSTVLSGIPHNANDISPSQFWISIRVLMVYLYPTEYPPMLNGIPTVLMVSVQSIEYPPPDWICPTVLMVYLYSTEGIPQTADGICP